MRYLKAPGLLMAVLCFAFLCRGQSCSLQLNGVVTDGSHQPIVGAIIRLEADSTKGAVTGSDGTYSISGICSGHIILYCKSIGYKTARVTADIVADSYVAISLLPGNTELDEVVVSGARVLDLHTVTQTELNGRALLQTRGESLGEALRGLSGLNVIQTGPSLAKPVIHGLHSNRVLILNNGVRQEGQQWGSEHAPEIDPFIANHISVIKGAASVRYGADALAGVVLLEPDPLPVEKGVGGNLYLVAGSNGRLGASSLSLQGAFDKRLAGLAWRVQGTLRRAGNFQTAKYYLKNTGFWEDDYSASVGYKHKGLETGFYYSRYATTSGIFEGSHVGNIADLYAAFNRSEPVTASYFSYQIDRSYQQVYHDLFKANAAYRFSNQARIEVNFARQKDKRDEFDIDLPYTTDPDILKKPQVSFQLITHSVDVSYIEPARSGFSGSIGLTGNTQGNVFRGIRYLIPNFRNYAAGAFAIERYTLAKMSFEAGLRYDYRWLRVYLLNPSSLQPYNSTFDYSNFSFTAGSTYKPNSRFSISLNVGTAWRAPSINELYIHGVHFSDASYQNGDSSLKSEHSINTSISANYQSKQLRITTDLYYNQISHFIYEQPQLKPITLISGTYPAFLFTQANVTIKGLDATLEYDVFRHLTLRSKATIVRGINNSIKDYLVYMPSDRFENGVTFSIPLFKLPENPYISVENVSVMRQKRVPPNSDYVEPPPGYSLFNANAGFTMAIKKKKLNLDLSVSNLTNVSYRDYLNHFRYYADDLGISFGIKIKISF